MWGPLGKHVATATLGCILVSCQGTGESLGAEPASPSRQLRAAQYEAIRGRLGRCGVNCLYLLARLHGNPVDYQQLLGELDAARESEGPFVSLLELRRAAQSVGFSCVVKKCSLQELETVGLPAIVHYRHNPAPGISRDELKNMGHYVLALEKNDSGFLLIDGSTLMLHSRSRDEFEPIWTGYVLVPRRDIIVGLGLTELGMISVTIGLWAGVWHILRKRPASRKVASDRGVRASRVVLWGVAILVCLRFAPEAEAGNASTDAQAGEVTWRTPENDARNCLYLLLRLHGLPVSYERLAAALPTTDQGVTLTELRDAARRFGLNLRIAKRTPAGLRGDRLPAIAHLDDGSPDEPGRYVLLLSCGDEQCRYVAGGHVTYRTVSTDEFRRSWGRFVLEPARASLWRSSLISVGVGSSVLGLYFVLRRPERRSSPHPRGMSDG